MKRSCLATMALVTLCLAGNLPLAAEGVVSGNDGSWTLSVRSDAGVLAGAAHEYVYDQSVSRDYVLSELYWPFAPLAIAGSGLSFETRSGFFSDLDIQFGFAGKSGTMTDSDFEEGDGLKTLYSESDCYTERANIIDIKAGMTFPISSSMRLDVFGHFSYMDFKWSARDGYYQYPADGGYWTEDTTKTPFYGTIGLYEQMYLIGALGLRANWSVGNRFEASASFSFSPLVHCWSADNHELRLIDIYAEYSGGFMLEPRISARYQVLRNASLSLDLSYRSVSGLVGDSTYVYVGTTSSYDTYASYAGPDSAYSYTDAAGASISFFSASLAFRLAL